MDQKKNNSGSSCSPNGWGGGYGNKYGIVDAPPSCAGFSLAQAPTLVHRPIPHPQALCFNSYPPPPPPPQDLDTAFSSLSLSGNSNSFFQPPGDNRMMLRSTMNNAYDTAGGESLAPFYASSSYYRPYSGFLNGSSAIRDEFPSHPFGFIDNSNVVHHNHRSLQQIDQKSLLIQSNLYGQLSNPFSKKSLRLQERFINNNNNGRNGWSMIPRRLEREMIMPDDGANVADLRGKLVNYAMDQNGCRILQSMFDKMGREELDMLFGEVIGHVSQLMMDQYGNFIFQKLVQVCSVDQRTQIVVAITQDHFQLVSICLNAYGTRAVQKLLMYLTTKEQKAMIVAAINPGVFPLSKDGNAHHVLVHCIKNFPYDLNQVFLDKMIHYCYELSTDQSGCCVVQSCVDHSRGEARDRLVHEIISVAQLLSEDRFGNYVVQCLLRQMDQMINVRMCEKLKGNFTSLSCNKFGSNVVEACLEQSDRRQVDLIILEMLENPHVSTLFSDPFGNYVTQVALTVSKGSVHEALVREIQKHAPSLQSNQYGKMTLSWFDPKKRSRSMRNKNKYGQFHHSEWKSVDDYCCFSIH